MHIVIVENQESIYRVLGLMIEKIIPGVMVFNIVDWGIDISVLDGIKPDLFFWAGEINGGNTTNQMLQVFREAFPQATHVAMSAGDPVLQMKLGCSVSMPKPFGIEALQEILARH